MKAPICDICLRSSLLCAACQGKLNRGDITESDVRVSREVFEASGKFKTLRGATIKRVMETPSNIIIIPEKGDAAKIIGRGGAVAKELTKALGKNVRIVEETSDRREFIERMLFPAKVSAVNVLFTPEGEVLKVIVHDIRKLPVSEENLREVMKEVYGRDVKVVSG